MNSFVLLGEALIDRKYGEDLPESKSAGGGSLNTAVGLSRLGESVTFVSQIGKDENGKLIRDYLVENGILVVCDELDTRETSVANAQIQRDGSAAYDFNVSFDISSIREKASTLVAAASVVHTGSIGSHQLPGCHALLEIFKEVSPTTLRSYDPNCRPTFNNDHNQVLGIVENFIINSNVVKASDEDVAWLYPDLSIKQVAQRWITLGAALVAITRGARGVYALRANQSEFDLAGYPVIVADTIGAGDSFTATLLSNLSKHGLISVDANQWLENISNSRVQEILELAVLLSADTCTRSGSNPPDKSRVNDLITRLSSGTSADVFDNSKRD